jgi:hypothetical protein
MKILFDDNEHTKMSLVKKKMLYQACLEMPAQIILAFIYHIEVSGAFHQTPLSQ